MLPSDAPLPGLPMPLPPRPALVGTGNGTGTALDAPGRPGGKPRKPRPPVEAFVYTVGEEIANSITHGLGLLLAIAGLAVLMARAAVYGDAWHITSGAVYGATLILLYGASTLYHAIPLPRAKAVFRVLDHAFIYLVIAGTYTPFTLVTLRGPWGWSLFGVIWAMAALGIGFKIFFTGRYEALSVAFYIVMGLCVVVAIKPLMANLRPGGLGLLVAGGASYLLGVFFYAYERLRYGHAVWHGFVLAGSALHYFAILFYVIPGAPGR